MSDTRLDLEQDNRPDEWWDELQQAAYDEAGAAVQTRLYGQSLDENRVFAEARQLKTEMAASGAFDSFDQWLAQVDQLPDIAVYLPDDVPPGPLVPERVLDWETEAQRDLDALPPLSRDLLHNPEAEAASAKMLFGPEDNHPPALGNEARDEAALNQMEAEFADLVAQLAAEVDFRSPPLEEGQSPRTPATPDLDF